MLWSGQWHLIQRPRGRPSSEDVRLVRVGIDGPHPGEVLVRNLVMSVEPYMLGRMAGVAGYAQPYALGAPMEGSAVGRVIASTRADVPEGSLVLTNAGWREHALVSADDCTLLSNVDLPPSVHLGALGITGMTAWVGINRIALLESGETLFVSSAAGGVGSIVVQIARAKGCPVVGSAGSHDKVAWLRHELGVEGAFCHRDGPAKALLRRAMEEAGIEGVDVYFDNVGGEQLEAAIRELRFQGRVVLCGMISTYDATGPVPGPRNLIRLIWQRARMEGFLLGDHGGERAEFEENMVGWLRNGTVKNVETTYQGGIDCAFSSFLQMLDGDGMGKAVVPLGTE